MRELDLHLGAEAFRRLPLPYEAGFVAGRAFVEYRRRGGVRTSPLPDFYIGAHAAVSGLCLLTRDARRYAGYFPKVRLISPDR
jgi:predicted nucleic acid-binding protein